jgi:hypothetical protein
VNRCTDPKIGVNVLSYDLLEGAEKEQLEKHLEECEACGDLVRQTFGDEGALQDIDLRAWHLARRRPVAPHEWIVNRIVSLWIPVLLLVFAVGALVLYLARRPPDPERVELVRLATSRQADLDSLSEVPLPRISPAPTSMIVQPDRDAIVLLYESGDGYLRRLIPGVDAVVPELRGTETHELTIPELDSATARILLVLAPAAAPRAVEAWDRAVWLNLGGEAEEGERRGWPQGVAATLRWVH